MQMRELKKISLEEIAEIDEGRIGVAFAQALSRLAADLNDRPGDDRPRKLNLQVEMTPTCDETGVCDSVQMQVQIKDSIPTRRSRKYDLGLRSTRDGGQLVYSPGSYDNHRQGTMDFDDEQES